MSDVFAATMDRLLAEYAAAQDAIAAIKSEYGQVFDDLNLAEANAAKALNEIKATAHLSGKGHTAHGWAAEVTPATSKVIDTDRLGDRYPMLWGTVFQRETTIKVDTKGLDKLVKAGVVDRAFLDSVTTEERLTPRVKLTPVAVAADLADEDEIPF